MKKSHLKQLIKTILEGINNARLQAENEDDVDQKEVDAMFKQWKAEKKPSAADDDSDCGYDLSDPKHPTYADRMADRADMDRSARRDSGISEGKTKGLSGMKKSPKKGDNTKMKFGSKSITSTDKPVEKKEGKKLPVKNKTSNTETNHRVTKTSTSALPTNSKKVGKALPVGGHGALKEEIVKMIRESLEEMSRVKGAIANKDRIPDPSSPTGYKHRITGVPVPAPKLTGQNYVKKVKEPSLNIDGDEDEDDDFDIPAVEEKPSVGLNVIFADESGEETPLEFDFLNTRWAQAKKYLEQEVMSAVSGALDPNARIGEDVYQKIEDAKEADLDGKLTTSNNTITLFYDSVSKSLRAK